MVFNHAYKFTHFSESGEKIRPENLSFLQKIKVVFLGIDNPRPANDKRPTSDFETIIIPSHELLEAWLIPNEKNNGLVLLFHGYSGSKSGHIDYSNEFQKLGFSTLLVDFQGCGGSTGNKTTIGIEESRDVKESFDYIKDRFPEEEIILFGSSMGAASILKAISDYGISPDKVILECPFGTMKATMKKRFQAMGLPSFPAAEILLLYGGAINGFNGFKHNPRDYAKELLVPTLLLHGGDDKRVLVPEVTEIYNNIKGEKELKILEGCGHEVYLNCASKEWKRTVASFCLQ